MEYPRKRWHEEGAACDDASVLSEKLSVPPAIAQILSRRGVRDASAAENFLNPKLSSLSDPFDIAGMREAVDRIWQAIEAAEQIVVFGDYDVDGVTSTALLVSLLRRLGGDVLPFLPEREQDGYGMSLDTLLRCVDLCQPALIITADCGTSSVEAVNHARSIGIDVVVTDHHEPGDVVAEAVAVINPKLTDCEDIKDLAGVGVVFRLCHALIKEGLSVGRAEVQKVDLRDWLDYVAVGTIADIVPLRGDNRILVWHGLNRLNRQLETGDARKCWMALAASAGIKDAVDSYQVGFVIGPRLNAAGRMGAPDDALKLLLAEDMETACLLADDLEKTNRERRRIEASIKSSAEKDISQYFDENTTFGIVAWGSDWHLGINGIVASRLTSLFSRPVVVLSPSDGGRWTGSCRSIDCFDVLWALEQCSDLLVSYGGHKMAAGVEVDEENLKAFRQRFDQVCASKLKGSDMRSVQNIDAWLTMSEIDERLYGLLRNMEPFGMGNPDPVLGVRGVSIVGQPKIVGKSGDHLKMTVAAGGRQIDAIGFGLGPYDLPSGQLDILFRLKENSFRGHKSLQMHVLDIRKSG